MKAITLRLTEKDRRTLESIKALGFGSITEVIKCAALSFTDSQHAAKGKAKPRKQPALTA